MTINEKAEYLESYGNLVEKIKELELEEKQLRETREAVKAIVYDDMPHGSKQSDLSDYMVELEKSQSKITKYKDELKMKKLKIDTSIALMENASESKLLKLHYIELLSWKCVASKLNCTEAAIYTLRRKALTSFKP